MKFSWYFCRSWNLWVIKSAINCLSIIILNPESPDNRLWQGEDASHETLRLDLRAVPAGKYELFVQMTDGGEPIRLGFKEEYEKDGKYKISDAEVTELS